MASSVTPAHSPAVNHPSQRTAGYSATHSAASTHFVTDAVTHGNAAANESAAGATTMPASGRFSVASAVRAAAGAITYVPAGTTGYLGSSPSYEHNDDGSYTYTGVTGSGTAVHAATLQGAILQWNAKNPTLAVSPTTTTTTTTPTTTPTTDPTPFTQLATLLSSLAAQTPVVASTANDQDTAATSVPTTSGPSLVIPLLLVLLACGIGYWWYTKHNKKHATAAAH